MTLSPGTRLGPYEVLAPLGAGGMGEVYRARDTRLGREVAVKVLPAEVGASPERVRRFEQEARAAGALNHPGLLAVHDVGAHEGQPYIVSELLRGATLADGLAEGPLPLRKALDYAIQAAEGLAHAHAQGIVHRDLKPANVFVTREGRVKILDFGLAKLVRPAAEASDDDDTRTSGPATTPGAVIGTVGYMAPEQVRGLEADQRSDLFALGAILFEMLTGRRAFKGETQADTMYAILREDPLEKGTARALPPAVERLLRRCLEKGPEERFQSAGDLAFHLRSLSTEVDRGVERPLSAPAPAAAARPSGWRRGLALALAAAVLALAALGVRSWWPAARVASIAVLPFENVSGDPGIDYLADGLTETLTHELARIRDLEVRTRRSEQRFRRQRESPAAAGRQLDVEVVVVGTVTRREDQVSISVELVDVARDRQLWGQQYAQRRLTDVMDVQQEIAGRIVERLRGPSAAGGPPTRDPVAYDLYLRGRQQWNRFREEGFLKAIDHFGAAIERDPGFALAHTGMADAYSLLAIDSHRPPREVMPRARAAARRALQIDAGLPEAHNSQAVYALFYEWDWPGAARSLERALELRPHYADAHHFRSHHLQAVGRAAESVAAARRALELEPLSPIVSTELGFAHYCARQYDAAVAQYTSTLEVNPQFVFARWLLAQAYAQQGRHAAAMAEIEKGLAVAPRWSFLRYELACAHAAAGRATEARRLVAELEEGPGYRDPGYAAWVYAQLGDHDAAFARLERALEERSSALVWLQVEPKLDGLRGDPRFAGLVRRMGPPPPGAGAVVPAGHGSVSGSNR
jgi:eukaryotic-like serine/threonine-protein kinase